MYKKINKLLIIISIVFTVIFTSSINADEYTINDLIENGKAFDRKNITITGEAIGEALNRGDYSWININDTTNAIGIYMTKADENKVDSYGRYKKKGDTIEVKGIFNRACKEHGGDMDIHATKVKVIKKGEKVKHNISKNKVFILVITTVMSISLGILFYIKNNK